MNIVCLVIDRLQAGYLGAYGNCWIETPELDRLAAESLTCDQVLLDTPELTAVYDSLWQRQHALVRRKRGVATGPSLPQICATAGWQTTLLTDDSAVAQHQAAAGFAELIRVDVAAPSEHPELAQTHIGQFFAQACETLGALGTDRQLVWLHTAGLGQPWDAPLEFLERYLDDEDEELIRFAEPPSRLLADDHDPDERLAIRRAYAAQVTLLDTCLGPLLDLIRDTTTALLLFSPRGFPLGEHGRVGAASDALYGELVHLPLLVRLPEAAMSRTQALIQPPDVAATLLELTSATSEPLVGAGESVLSLNHASAACWRDRVALVNAAGERALRTPAWYFRVPFPQTADAIDPVPAELFCKPDDRWEQNEVADRCPEIVGKLEDALVELEHRAGEDLADEASALDVELIEGLG